jgi:hypothetical protein
LEKEHVALSSTLKTQAKTSEDILMMLEGLEKLIDRTKVMYEQYFMGIQKMAPSQLHRDCERRIRELQQQQIRNTALRFRFTTLSQKFGSYNVYWKRIMRQIENGTYIRDIQRLGRQALREGKEIPQEVLAKMPKRMRDRIVRDRERIRAHEARKAGREEDLRADPNKVRQQRSHVHAIEDDPFAGDFDLDNMFSKIMEEESGNPAVGESTNVNIPIGRPSEPDTQPVRQTLRGARATRPAVPPAQRRAPTPPPTGPRPPPGMSEQKSRQLYDKYIKARKLVGERTDNISYDKLMRTLNKQAPKIMTDHQARGVDFNVVIKGDKVVLKAKPQK